ncbi:MAG: hypothetical protein CNLJKLNK_00036 [Holosporales bacterium]
MVYRYLYILCFIMLSVLSCFCEIESKTWLSGWYDWNPYQYVKDKNDPKSLTGLDVEFTKLLMDKFGKNIEIPPVDWKQHQDDIKEGKRHIAAGAFATDDRKQYAYISKTYRDEENSFFILKKNDSGQNYTNAEEFLDYVKKNKIKIAIIDGYKVADDRVNAFVNDPKNKNFVIKTKTDLENVELTQKGKVDGFLADRVVGATVLWHAGLTKDFSEKYLNMKASIHFLLSKKLVCPEEVEKIDHIIDQIKNSPEFTKLVSWYYYPIILMQTTDTFWFFILEIVGILSFTISGLILAARMNTTLLGAFMLAFVPSVGGGVIRDVMFNRHPIWIVQNKNYMILFIVVVLVGFLFIKMYDHFNFKKNKKLHDLSDHIIVIADALGLAVFTVSGVLVSMIVKTDPLWLWGPVFALLTGAGGGMLRDIVVKSKNVDILYGEIYGELSIIWGGILSVYLSFTAQDTNPDRIVHAVIFCVIGCFLTRMLLHYCKVSNIVFGKEER